MCIAHTVSKSNISILLVISVCFSLAMHLTIPLLMAKFICEAVTTGMSKFPWIASEEVDSDMGTNALMGSNFDCVSNRSYSRMHGSI